MYSRSLCAEHIILKLAGLNVKHCYGLEIPQIFLLRRNLCCSTNQVATKKVFFSDNRSLCVCVRRKTMLLAAGDA